MNRNLMLVLLLVSSLLAGCANNRWRAQEATAYYNNQQLLATARKPLFELKAQPGQVIMLTGVESLVVNDPREQRIEALPQQRSPAWELLATALRIGGQVYGAKVAADGVVNIVEHATRNAGDHSITTTTISDSYNTQGDTLTNSIRGNVNGAGAGVGNEYSSADTNVRGNGNATGVDAGRDVNVGDRNANTGRQDSPDDNSNPGNECTGERCQGNGDIQPGEDGGGR